MITTCCEETGIGSIFVVDDFLPEPEAYREAALERNFVRVDLGHIVFNGIALAPLESGLARLVQQCFPQFRPTLSVFRKSPAKQVEPNFIHCDAELGDWTALLYLNPHPAPGDGTDFWKDLATDAIRGTAEYAVTLKDPSLCLKWKHFGARFNRLLMFQSDLFHSRALHDNYGEGDDARLIQVVFGSGAII